jgi:endoglucanase
MIDRAKIGDPMDFDLLARIVNTPGIPGCEDAVQEVVAAEMRAVCDDVWRDRLGNVIGLKKAGRAAGAGRTPRVALAAHVDEIGAVVKHIDGDGYIRFQRVGGLYSQTLQSQMVIVHGREPLKGVIAPDFNLHEGDKIPSPDDLLIDLGLPKETVDELVQLGDPITFAQELVQLNDQVVMGRNFDDRMGTYCLIEAARRTGDAQVDAYFVSTVQEEVGVRGMPVAAFAIEPDLGLAIDGSLVRAAHVKPHTVTCDMGKGTGIYLMDNLTIGDRRLVRFLFDLCERESIPFQRNIGGGTDASAIQRARLGALATTVGAPVRYMHSTVQLCHLDDIEATIRLLVAFIERAHELVEGVE